jgi:hypothetical protein
LKAYYLDEAIDHHLYNKKGRHKKVC